MKVDSQRVRLKKLPQRDITKTINKNYMKVMKVFAEEGEILERKFGMGYNVYVNDYNL